MLFILGKINISIVKLIVISKGLICKIYFINEIKEFKKIFKFSSRLKQYKHT